MIQPSENHQLPKSMSPKILLGTGGGQPSVVFFNSSDEQNIFSQVVNLQRGTIPTQLAQSEDGNRFAVAVDTGQIMIFEIGEQVRHIADCWHQCTGSHVSGLIFAKPNIILSVGYDQVLKILDITTREKLIATIPTPGILFGITMLTDDLFCGIGRSGTMDHLFILSLSKRAVIYQGPPFKITTPYHTAKVVTDLRGPVVAHTDRSGNVHNYIVRQKIEHSLSATPHGNFTALALDGNKMITVGKSDGLINMWSFGIAEPINQVRCDSGCIWITCLGGNTFVAGFDSGKLVLLKTDTDTIRIEKIYHLQNMSCFARPARMLILQSEEDRNREWKDISIATAKQLIDQGNASKAGEILDELDARGFKDDAARIRQSSRNQLMSKAKATLIPLSEQEFLPILRMLESLGYRYEAGILTAEYYGQKNLPLLKLKCLKEMLEHLPENWSIMSMLADLLLNLNEPNRAMNALLEAERLGAQGLTDLKTRCEQHFLYNILPERCIRNDFTDSNSVLQEIDKLSMLGEIFRWKVMVKQPKVHRLMMQFNIEKFCEEFLEGPQGYNRYVEQKGYKPLKIVDEEYLFHSLNEKPINTRVIRFVPMVDDSENIVQFLLALREDGNITEMKEYIVFVPETIQSYSDNRLIAESWQQMLRAKSNEHPKSSVIQVGSRFRKTIEAISRRMQKI